MKLAPLSVSTILGGYVLSIEERNVKGRILYGKTCGHAIDGFSKSGSIFVIHGD